MDHRPKGNVFKRLGPPSLQSIPSPRKRPLIAKEVIDKIKSHIRPIPRSSADSSSSTQAAGRASSSSSSSTATRPSTSSAISASGKKTCPSCQRDDHQRSSSHKCLNRKLARKLLLTEKDVQQNSFTIKTSLKKWLTNNDLRDHIKADVAEMSAMYIEVTILLNFTICKSLVEVIEIISEPDILRMFQPLKLSKYSSKRAIVIDDEYTRLREAHSRPLYECKYRTALIQELAKQLQTAAKNCICVHMRARICRWINRFYFGFLHNRTKSGKETLINHILDNIFAGTSVYDNTQEVRLAMMADLGKNDFKNLQAEWWTFYNVAFKLQQYFIRNQPPPPPPASAVGTIKKDQPALPPISMRSFSLCPLASHGLKHIHYTTDAYYNLLRATELIKTDAKSLLSEPEFLMDVWSSNFNVSQFHKPNRNKTFAMSFTTNSVDASIQMLRPQRELSTR